MTKTVKILTIFIIFIAIIFFTSTVNAGVTENGLTYEKQNDGIHIIDCDENITGELIVPNEIDGEKIIAIDRYTFLNCSELTSIYLPSNITTLDDTNIFGYCTKLTDIKVSAENEYYCDDNGILFNSDKSKIIAYPIGKTEINYTIPNNVKEIGSYSFMNCTNLKYIIISNNVKKIGNNAFDNCTNLKTIFVYMNSYAKQYVIENDYNYQYIDYLKELEFKTLKKLSVNNIKCLTNFDTKNNTVTNIIESESEALGELYTLKFYKDNKEITGDLKIGTGTIIKVMFGDIIQQEYNAIIYGDVTGKGSPNAVDALSIVKNKLGTAKFINEIYEEAGKVTETTRNSNTIPSSVDALSIVKYKLGNGNIDQDIKPKYNDFTMVGTIEIPDIKLNYPILEGVSNKALDTAVCLQYGKLNKVGNSVVIGQNYRNGTFFSNLHKLSNGNKITITDYTGKKVTYSVYSIFEATPEDTSFYTRNTNGIREITLSTCTDDNSMRTIILAKELENIETIRLNAYNYYTEHIGVTIINGIENDEDYGEIIARFDEITESIANNWSTYLDIDSDKRQEELNYLINLGNLANINIKYENYDDLNELWTKIYNLEKTTRKY